MRAASVALLAAALAVSSSMLALAAPTFQSEVQQRDKFGTSAYKFTFPEFAANTAAGTIRNMDIGSDPFLGTLPRGGLAQNVDVFAPCTLNVPHVHPRGNEIYYVVDGELLAGIQEEVGGKFAQVELSSNQNVVVPQGLLHYVYNPSCSNTSLLQIWDNSDFGTVIVYANMINNFPNEILSTVTGADAATIASLKASVPKPTGAITQDKACLAKCQSPSPSPSPGASPSSKASPSPSPSPSPSTSSHSSYSSDYSSSTNGLPAVASANAVSTSGRRLRGE